MPARIKYKEGDYVDPEHNLLFIRDVPSKINGRRRIGVYDLEYDEYFEACLNDLRRGHTKHSWNTSYQIRSKKNTKWSPGEIKEIFGQPILCLSEVEPHYYIEGDGKKHKIRRGRFQNLNTYIVFECDFSSAYSGSSLGIKKSKGEILISNILDELDINYLSQYVFYDCRSKNNRVLYFDFYLPDYNCCIEYDGEQHQLGWKRQLSTLDDIQDRDMRKNKYCSKHNISLIRIPYTDFNKIDAQYILDKIQEVK